MVSQCKSELMLVFFSHHSSFAVLIDFISITRIWEQLLFNIRWLIYYLWWSIANRNSHFSFLHHMSEANASYLEWNGKCFIAEWNGAASSSGVFYEAFCGDAAKYEAHLAMHEAALRAMKQSLTASFRHFFCKKMAERAGFEPAVRLPPQRFSRPSP